MKEDKKKKKKVSEDVLFMSRNSFCQSVSTLTQFEELFKGGEKQLK